MAWDRIRRCSLGVSETAPTYTTVKPTPSVGPEVPATYPTSMVFQGGHGEALWNEEIDEFGNVVNQVPVGKTRHDEL